MLSGRGRGINRPSSTWPHGDRTVGSVLSRRVWRESGVGLASVEGPVSARPLALAAAVRLAEHHPVHHSASDGSNVTNFRPWPLPGPARHDDSTIHSSAPGV